MNVLLLGNEAAEAIAELKVRAEAQPLVAENMLNVLMVDPLGFRDMMNMYSIDLPIGYRVTFCVERQPSGSYYHLAISVGGELPSFATAGAIAREFGMGRLQLMRCIWVEEMGGGRQAINLLQLINEEKQSR